MNPFSLRARAGLVAFAALALGYFAAATYENAPLGAVVTAGVCVAGLPFVTGRPLHLLGAIDAAGIVNDGSVVYGTQLVLTNWVAESINITRGTREIAQMQEKGLDSKSVYIPTKARGTLTLQLPDGTTAAPARGAVLALTPMGGGSSVNYLITEVSDVYQIDGAAKVNVSVAEKLN